MNLKRNPVGWFEIYVQDMERAKTFYQGIFQIALNPLASPMDDFEMWSFPPQMNPDGPGCSGALCKMKDKDSGSGGTLIYFSCADCAVEASRVPSHGGQVHMGKKPIGEYGFIALVIDTEGNMIGLHSME